MQDCQEQMAHLWAWRWGPLHAKHLMADIENMAESLRWSMYCYC
jgi:hypothetical protein